MLARSVSRKRSSGGSLRNGASSDQSSQEDKQGKGTYSSPRFVPQMEVKGYYMKVDQDEPIVPLGQELANIRELLAKQPEVPAQSRFSDDTFKDTLANMADQNEARVTRDICELIFPSAQYLVSLGLCHTRALIDMVNDQWTQARPILLSIRPQPDITVGFKRKAFTDEQLAKLGPYIGESGLESSWFAANIRVLFPWITNEVKSAVVELNIADNQNAYSMFTAVTAIVKLYELVGRDLQQINRRILAFSISHNDKEVRIYGYFPNITNKITYHRHEIKTIWLKANDGQEKWTAYRFVASLYEWWAPNHLKRIRDCIDEMPVDAEEL